MLRRYFCAGLLSLLLTGALEAQTVLPAGADRQTIVNTAQQYLNGLTTMQSRFTQIAADGTILRGDVYIKRPARMLIDYDPPSKIRLVAPGDWRLIFYDGSIKQVNVIPIRQTPLGVLLERQIEFDEMIDVLDVEESTNTAIVTMARKEQHDQGNVALYFSKNPFSLVRWVTTDAQGIETTVVLQRSVFGAPLKNRLFHWRSVRIFGYPED